MEKFILKQLDYWATIIAEKAKQIKNGEKINIRDLEISVDEFNAYFSRIKAINQNPNIISME